MTSPISTSAPSTPAAAPAKEESLEGLMAQRFMMSAQQNQRALSQSMTKMADQIKASMQDDE